MAKAKKLIMDSLHGGIEVNELETMIIDHPLVQRLRYIFQNDVLHYCFPGATHNRFAHSIGSMHVSGILFDGIIENTVTDYGQKNVVLRESEKEAINYIRQVVRIAVLLHDTGHGPFSHQAERSKTLQSIMNPPGRFKQIWEGVDDIGDFYDEEPEVLHHEHYSVRAAEKILTEVTMSYELRRDVMSMLDTTNFCPSHTFIEAVNRLPVEVCSRIGQWTLNNPGECRYKKFMSVISNLVSGVIDADRLDYLMRDTLYTGSKYGNFNVDLLTHCMALSHHEGWFGISIREQGKGVVEDFLHARMRMYRQVYQHKTARGCFGYILHRALEEVVSQKDFADYISDLVSDMDKFIAFNDTMIMAEIMKYSIQHPKSMCARLVNRRGIEHLVTIDDDQEWDADEIRKQVLEKSGCKDSRLVMMHDKFAFAPKPTSSKFDVLRIKMSNSFMGEKSLVPLKDALPLYETFEKGIDIYTFLKH